MLKSSNLALMLTHLKLLRGKTLGTKILQVDYGVVLTSSFRD